jgi:hypothetical protein
MLKAPLFPMRYSSVENSTAIKLTEVKTDVRLLPRNAQ